MSRTTKYWLKAAVNILLATLTLVLVAILWQQTIILVLLLMAIGMAMYFVSPTRSSIVVYLVSFVCGPLAEAIAMQAGAWSYASPAILGFPLWLPFVWANCSLFIKNTADLSSVLFFTGKK